MCKDTSFKEKITEEVVDNEESKNKVFIEAKLHQDPMTNAIGVNDTDKLMKIKEEQSTLSEFDKDYCKHTIQVFNGEISSLDKTNQSELQRYNTLKYFKNKFVRLWNNRCDNEMRVKDMNQNGGYNNDFSTHPEKQLEEGETRTKINPDKPLEVIEENKNEDWVGQETDSEGSEESQTSNHTEKDKVQTNETEHTMETDQKSKTNENTNKNKNKNQESKVQQNHKHKLKSDSKIPVAEEIP